MECDTSIDRSGTPLGITLIGLNRHDSRMMARLLDAVPDARLGRARSGRPPTELNADQAYDRRRRGSSSALRLG